MPLFRGKKSKLSNKINVKTQLICTFENQSGFLVNKTLIALRGSLTVVNQFIWCLVSTKIGVQYDQDAR
jgi:hypothetical protein